MRLIRIGLYVISAWIILYIFVSSIIFNPTISATRGYYFTYPSESYKVGDMVLMCVLGDRHVATMFKLKLPYVNDACLNHTPYLLKHVVAVEGDVIDVTKQGIYINGRLQPNSIAKYWYKNIELYPVALGEFRLGRGQFLVLGDTVNSYDSRYFGVLDKAQIYRLARLIWSRDKPLW